MVSSGSVSLGATKMTVFAPFGSCSAHGPQMQVTEFLLAHANALLCRLRRGRLGFHDMAQHRDTPQPKRAQRQASRLTLAVRFLPRVAGIDSSGTRTHGTRTSSTTRQEKRES